MRAISIVLKILIFIILVSVGLKAFSSINPGFHFKIRQLQQIVKKEKVTVAIIDTGVDLNHVDLKQYIWRNKGEVGPDKSGKSKSSNGVDDDNNGFIDDSNGWNFIDDSNQLVDDHGHGTHIAGIVAAKGVWEDQAPQVSLMILKYYKESLTAQQNIENTVNAIDYAVKMGAHIINYSSGGGLSSYLERRSIERARKKGVLFVSAAGNLGINSDRFKFYPAGYQLSNIISVGAVDLHKNILESSNYGKKSVDVLAPGQNIYSTLPKNKYGFMSGTSQATAVVSRIAAKVWLKKSRSYLNPKKWLQAMMKDQGRFSESYRAKTKWGVILGQEMLNSH